MYRYDDAATFHISSVSPPSNFDGDVGDAERVVGGSASGGPTFEEHAGTIVETVEAES